MLSGFLSFTIGVSFRTIEKSCTTTGICPGMDTIGLTVVARVVVTETFLIVVNAAVVVVMGGEVMILTVDGAAVLTFSIFSETTSCSTIVGGVFPFTDGRGSLDTSVWVLVSSATVFFVVVVVVGVVKSGLRVVEGEIIG